MNPALSTAKMTADKRGLIVFDCQIIVFDSQKRCLLVNCSAFADYIIRSGLPPIRCCQW